MGQLARLEEDLLTNSIKSSTEMTPGSSHLCCFFCRNLPPIDFVEDELAREPGPVRDLYLDSTSPIPSRNSTLGPTLVSALIPISAFTLVFTNKFFKQFMKAYLELNQGTKQSPVERKQTLMTIILEVYYGKLHIDYYYSCQRCKDYFETTRASRANQTPFAVFFLYENISVHWALFKHYHWGNELTPITWTEFKDFLQKNLGESKSFVNSIWKKRKRDSQY